LWQFSEELTFITRVGKALNRGTVADSSRVEADNVEACLEIRWKVAEPIRQIFSACSTRTAGIEKQRTNATRGISSWMFNDSNVDGGTVWILIVERHLRGGTLEPALSGGGAGLPCEYRYLWSGKGIACRRTDLCGCSDGSQPEG
jgi:hypothetical protein